MGSIPELVDRLADMAGNQERADTWHGLYGRLVADALHKMGADAERVVTRWMGTQKWAPKPVELSETYAAILAERADENPDEAPPGCRACGMMVTETGARFGGQGILILRWVAWNGHALVERTRAVLCDCAKGAWLAEHHAQGPAKDCDARGPVRMKTARETAAELERQPVGHLGALTSPCVLWWVIETRDRPYDEQTIPADLRAALAQQHAAERRAEQERRLRERTGEARRPEVRVVAPRPRPREAEDQPPRERRLGGFQPPLRPDQGWERQPEWFGGAK